MKKGGAVALPFFDFQMKGNNSMVFTSHLLIL
jgi:hypothetical protein